VDKLGGFEAKRQLFLSNFRWFIDLQITKASRNLNPFTLYLKVEIKKTIFKDIVATM
jgi:hypothetical protein